MKHNQIKDPFENLVLDEYEQEIEDAFERGEYTSVSPEEFEATKKMFEEAAKRHTQLQQSQKITFRINQGDLIKLKAKAVKKTFLTRHS